VKLLRFLSRIDLDCVEDRDVVPLVEEEVVQGEDAR